MKKELIAVIHSLSPLVQISVFPPVVKKNKVNLNL